MFDIKITGLDQLKADLKDMSERRIRSAAATAMTRTAVKVRDRMKDELQQAFDRPTPFTTRQLLYTPATADRPVAAVGFNIAAIQDVHGNVVKYKGLAMGETPASKYLQFQTEGGQRSYKRFEKALQSVGVLPRGWYAVPGSRAKVDAFGNQSVGEIRQILSWFDAAELVAGSRQNMRDAGRDKRRKGTRKASGFEYVAILPGARGGLRPGIYRRTFMALGRRIEPVVIFVRGTAYRKRFDFYNIAQQEADAMLPREFSRAINESRARMGDAR